MSDLLIRDLSSRTHEELKRRARNEGMSLQAYVMAVLESSIATPSLADWLTGLDDLPRHDDLSGAEAVNAARRDLP